MALDERIPNNLIGAAGVHHVVSELSRRKLVALPTIRNVAGYDVVVTNCDGTKHANIQVKTSQNKVASFPMPRPEKIRTGRHDWYVLLRWLEDQKRFEGFMVKGREAKAAVEREITKQRKRRQEERLWPCLRLDRWNDSASGKWRRKWEEWTC